MQRVSDERLKAIAGDECSYASATHDEYRAIARELAELRGLLPELEDAVDDAR